MHTGKNILIVEDEMIVAQELKERLIELGYKVDNPVMTGEQAIESVDQNPPDLVLMDIILKGNISGLEAADIISTRFDIPIIYLTAIKDDITLQRSQATKPYGYIVKPFDEKELQFAIEIALDKHAVEQKIKEREKWLTTVLNSIKEGVLTIDSNFKITFMNPVAERLTGWLEEEAIGKPLQETFRFFYKRDKSGSPDFSMLQLSDSSSFNQEGFLEQKDGMMVSIELTSTILKDIKEELLGWIFVFRDISSRKLTEIVLQKSEEKFNVLLGMISEGVGVFDKNGHVTFVNDALCEMCGFSKQEIINSHFRSFLDSKSCRIIEKQLYKRRRGERSPYSIELNHKNGKPNELVINPQPLFDDDGEFIGSIMILRNMSDLNDNKYI